MFILVYPAPINGIGIDSSPTPRIYYPQFYFKQIEMEEFDARSDK